MDLHELTAGYALDALDPDEQAQYEAHLASCEPCRDELQGFWQVSASLARAAGGPQPPAALRNRILEQARKRAAERRPAPPPVRAARALVRRRGCGRGGDRDRHLGGRVCPGS